MSLCLRVLSSQSDLMIDVFGDQSRNALANMLAANDNKDGDEVSISRLVEDALVMYIPIQKVAGFEEETKAYPNAT